MSRASHHYRVGARGSSLSKKQVEEVLLEICKTYPEITFEPVWVETSGDKDKFKSLKSEEKSDFFTKEIEELQLQGAFDLSIHSAKDLPLTLREDLTVVALTRGISSRDLIVFKTGEVRSGARIGTSSLQREKRVLSWRGDLQIVDIRGTIEERLNLLERGFLEGVVIAEAALIRLGYEITDDVIFKKGVRTHPYRLLEGDSTPLQGQLAIVVKRSLSRVAKVFSILDTREVLYFGLHPRDHTMIHYPLIETEEVPLSKEVRKRLDDYTDIIFTSRRGVSHFFNQVDPQKCCRKQFFVTGEGTARELSQYGIENICIPKGEFSQEGVVALLQEEKSWHQRFVLLAGALKTRDVLPDFFQNSGIAYDRAVLYQTKFKKVDLISCWDRIQEIVFTSPSTVDAFFTKNEAIPSRVKISFQGRITQEAFERKQRLLSKSSV